MTRLPPRISHGPRCEGSVNLCLGHHLTDPAARVRHPSGNGQAVAFTHDLTISTRDRRDKRDTPLKPAVSLVFRHVGTCPARHILQRDNGTNLRRRDSGTNLTARPGGEATPHRN